MTIYALSTAPQRGAIAIIRISGEGVKPLLQKLTHKPPPPPRMAQFAVLYEDTNILDEALILYFAAPQSYSGEDMAELHIHGGTHVVSRLLTVLSREPDMRPAQAGEFTRRAVLNGKMDLTRAEAIADLIDAETEAQHHQAIRQLRGELGALYETWRTRLTHALAHIEADIEFAEEDLPGGIGTAAFPDLQQLCTDMAAHIDDARGISVREGLAIAIMGAPNVGKSSILNHIAGRGAAITSDQPGTTRDIIDVPLTLAGIPVVFSDTAGLRDTADAIEQEGVKRALARGKEADIRIFVLSATDITDAPAFISRETDFLIANKCDLAPPPKGVDFALSAKTGTGFDNFLAALEGRIRMQYGLGEAPRLTRLRHRQALQESLTALSRGLAARDDALELAAEDLRLANRALGRITGAVDVEALLDIVFSDFCIGK